VSNLNAIMLMRVNKGDKMSIQLKNECIEVEILKTGGELCSLKLVGDDTEYIWNADPAHWKRHAPVLFPIVGRVVNDQYRVNGVTYHLGQHGFARDMDFTVSDQSESHVTLTLKWSNETLKVYPFKFEFAITYAIVKNKVSIEYYINNLDNQPIYFSIGAHPGFNCPINEGESTSDYYFEFETNEDAGVTLLTKNGLFKREKIAYLNNQNTIEINNELFKNGALIFDNLNSKRISLKSRKSERCVHVNFEGFPFLGLWSKSEGAPFVCIEPWIGHADYVDFEGDFSTKEDQICLDVQDVFTKKFEIIIE
jgi:galactose mutarotase-like enzyme